MLSGTTDLPLHHGKAPAWLFNRMVRLAKPITQAIILEYGPKEFLQRISNPFFFQSLGCVLGFDWHSSGLTTTLNSALKKAITPKEGISVAGGKGKQIKNTHEEIISNAREMNLSETKIQKLLYADKISAKVDNNLVQDSYPLYQHTFFFTEDGKWAVVQQGMNTSTKYARRYHWISDSIKSYIQDPHQTISAEKIEEKVLNLSDKRNKKIQKTSLDLAKENPSRLLRFTKSKQTTLSTFHIKLPKRHQIIPEIDIKDIKALKKAYEQNPENYEQLIMTKGIGKKSLRALALISSIIYGDPICWEDPAKFSYAHGGKDGIPFPVQRKTYDSSIEILQQAVKEAKINQREKINALKRLSLRN